jgi:hypothetical protein
MGEREGKGKYFEVLKAEQLQEIGYADRTCDTKWIFGSD